MDAIELFLSPPLGGDAQLLFLVNILLVLLITGFSAGVAVVLVRRSVRQRVEAERLAAMGTATARILHQVKNPLQTLLLNAEMLQAGHALQDAESQREATETIVGQATRMVELLSELSAYASGTTRRLHLSPIELRELVGRVAEDIRPTAEQAGITLGVAAPDSLVADADAYFLPQALENVLRNACDALREAPSADPRRIEVTLRRRGDEAVVEVRDTGPGIEPQRIAAIFEPFVTSKPKGMGLGLPICREILEAHGGRVEMRSSVGKGTTVALALPLRAVLAGGPHPK